MKIGLWSSGDRYSSVQCLMLLMVNCHLPDRYSLTHCNNTACDIVWWQILIISHTSRRRASCIRRFYSYRFDLDGAAYNSTDHKNSRWRAVWPDAWPWIFLNFPRCILSTYSLPKWRRSDLKTTLQYILEAATGVTISRRPVSPSRNKNKKTPDWLRVCTETKREDHQESKTQWTDVPHISISYQCSWMCPFFETTAVFVGD